MPAPAMPSYHDLGAKVLPSGVYLAVFLPGLNEGVRVTVQVVRERDFFDATQRKEYALKFDSVTGLWSVTVAPSDLGVDTEATTFLYWFCVAKGPDAAEFQADPYAREFGFGKFSAFTTGLPPAPPTVQVKDIPLEETVLYELNIMEFGGSIRGCTNRLNYLQDLGINCLLVMPVHNISDQVNWGYLPLGYFGIDERLGNRRDFQEFVNACHERNIRVVLDVVFAHTSGSILYQSLYKAFNIESPLSGQANQWGGTNIDFSKPFAAHFVKDAISSIIENLDIDGLRFDWVAGFWSQYPDIVEHAEAVFANAGKKNPILLAELLDERVACPKEALSQTKSNCCYQNATWDNCRQLAIDSVSRDNWDGSRMYQLGIACLASHDFAPFEATKKYALQYIENHDHSRFVTNFYGNLANPFDYILENADRTSHYRKTHWYRIRPYLIAILLARGIPLLWQGQELCENYWMTEGLSDGNSISRVKVLRNVRWEYCVENEGAEIRRLVKDLIQLRLDNADAFCRGEYYFYNDFALYQSRGLLLFSRKSDSGNFLVVLNFSNNAVTDVPCPAPFDTFNGTGELRQAAVTHGRLSMPKAHGDVLRIG